MGEKKYLRLTDCLKTKTAQLKFGEIQRILIICNIIYPGLSLRGGGRGFPPATMNMAQGYFQRKIEPKENNNCLIPRLLVVFTLQPEISLVTPLFTPHSFLKKIDHMEIYNTRLTLRSCELRSRDIASTRRRAL